MSKMKIIQKRYKTLKNQKKNQKKKKKKFNHYQNKKN